MASIKNMLSKYYFIAGEKQAISDIIQESIEPDEYYQLTNKLKEKYETKLLNKI